MKIGLIGLPSSGKTTVFNALTGSDLPTGSMTGAPFEIHTAVVSVPDVRMDALTAFYHPHRTTPAQVTYADISGLKADVGREGLPGPLVNQLEQMDGLIHILRAFPDEVVPHPQGSVNPARDASMMASEFIIHDMLVVAKRLEHLHEDDERNARDRGEIERDIRLFERLEQALDDGQAVRELTFSRDEDRRLAGYGLLSRKPMLHVLNLAEGQELSAMDPEDSETIALQGELEMELAQLSEDEAKAFFQEYGIQDPARKRIIRASYELLHLQSFFTVGEDEVRAWTIPLGATALDAAGTIHSDLARGFIRAEVIPWNELLDMGGLPEARQGGKLRLEGKSYIVEDGDIVHIRFNI